MFTVLDTITLIVFVGMILLFTLRGFLRSAVGILKFVGAFFLAKIFGPMLGGLISLHVIGPAVYAWIEEKVAEMVGGISDTMNLGALFEEGSGFADLLTRFGASDQLESLKTEYGNTLDATKTAISDMVRSFASPWVDRISNVIATVLIFVAALFVLILLTKILKSLIDRATVARRIDRILGAVLGLVTGGTAIFVFCYALSLIIAVLSFFGNAADGMIATIDGSMIFKWIYHFIIG